MRKITTSSKNITKRNFTTLFIDGNHENHDLLDKYYVAEWNGGKIHRISDSVIHLMRGQVYTIDGIKFFAMGGAESTDRAYRREGESWWVREMPSDKEYKEARKNLGEHDFKVDVVLTHCAPEGYIWKNMMPVYNCDLTRVLHETIGSVVDRSGNRLRSSLMNLSPLTIWSSSTGISGIIIGIWIGISSRSCTTKLDY